VLLVVHSCGLPVAGASTPRQDRDKNDSEAI
jgi:hypothetical protein